METTIQSQSEAVQFLYKHYLEKKYIVNRKYQRKLVWTLSEKQAFIDSLRKQYSVPLFLLAEAQDSNEEGWEIIDGLQRMNAICSFIENEFPIQLEDGTSAFFNLDTLADSRMLLDRGELTQGEPILDREICTKIAMYPLPISIIKADNKSIETVFRRINSYGRKLSDQEIRLAGAVGLFPKLVRVISSTIRGDVSTDDILNLNQMKLISISHSHMKYGINLQDIFWIKNKIIPEDNIRTSRDEELVSYILSYILLGDKIPPTKQAIDSLYQYNEESYETYDINDQIEKIGFDKLKMSFIAVHDVFATLSGTANKPLRDLICRNDKIHGLFRTYQVLFLAIYRLLIEEDLKKVDFKLLVSKIDGIGIREFDNISSPQWEAQMRKAKIDAVVGIVRCAFSKDKTKDVSVENWVQQLQNLLTLSRSEGTQYDFKQTCFNLSTGKFDDECVRKMVKTLTAEANNPNSIGYVIIGVADKKAAADKYIKTYGGTYRATLNDSFFVTGIQSEVRKYYSGKYDDYVKKIKGVISKCPIAEKVKLEIMQNFKQVTYYGHEVIILSLHSFEEPIYYDNEAYVRKGNDCIKISGAEVGALYKLFVESTKL